jgi:hypothetical protein
MVGQLEPTLKGSWVTAQRFASSSLAQTKVFYVLSGATKQPKGHRETSLRLLLFFNRRDWRASRDD